MDYTDSEKHWIDVVIPKLPVNRFFDLDAICADVLPKNDTQFIKEMSGFIRAFLIENCFIRENVLNVWQDEKFVELTIAGNKLHNAGSYGRYLSLINAEERKKRWKERKENINLFLTLVAAIASVYPLINWSNEKRDVRNENLINRIKQAKPVVDPNVLIYKQQPDSLAKKKKFVKGIKK